MRRPTPGAPGAQSAAPAQPPPRISSASLLGPAGIVLIAHEGATYTLRRTRNGKLILTK